MDLKTILTKSEELHSRLYSIINIGGRNLVKKCKTIDSETRGTCIHSTLYVALKYNRYYIVSNLLNNGSHFGAVDSTGQFAGFTALHYACLQGHIKVVKKLFAQHQVNPTVKACDGVEPIHLAALRGHFDIVYEIFRHNAGYNSKLSYSHFLKYAIDVHEWETNYCDELYLLAYLVLNSDGQRSSSPSSIVELFTIVPTWSIVPFQDINNKTLLMYAIEKKLWNLVSFMFEKLPKQELIRRDNSGFSAIHMLAANILDATGKNIYTKRESWDCLREFRNRGVIVDVRVNADLRIFPLNIAAYCCDDESLDLLLEKQSVVLQPSARPLFYFTKGRNDGVLWNGHSFKHNPTFYESYIKTLRIIIDDIYKKQLCNYPVHKEEIKLIEQWTEKKDQVKKLVKEIDEKYKLIESKIKNIKVVFGHREMSLYQALTAHQREYNAVAMIKDYYLELLDWSRFDADIPKFAELINRRLQETREILFIIAEKREKVATRMIKSFLLPYDCILNILDYLSFDELNCLVKTFFKKASRKNPHEI